ncbi:MAG: panthothenate synthetase [Vulcanimicrobiaceae bacterium]
MHVEFPGEPFNSAVRNGTAGQQLQRILADIKPEAAYFSECDGHRGGVLVVNLDDPSDVPRFAEPFFLTFNAEVRFRVAMTPDDLGRSNIEALGKKWS